jgi:protein-disulfide isomerase
MKTALMIASGVFAAALAAAAVPAPLQAKTMKECAAQWQEMKAANQTEGMKYRDFSKKCMSEATPAAENPPPAKPEAAAPPAAGGNAVFPSAVSSKYSGESAGKARRHTCLDQYNANKASGGNAGLKWIQKGGGYYSECNKHLKGAA